MSDDFCFCGECHTEVRSVYLYDYVKREYEVISGQSYCEKCKKVMSDGEVFWQHVEYNEVEE